jgi:hypothetical protein
MGNPTIIIINNQIQLTTKVGVKSLLFTYICLLLSDRLIVVKEGRILHFVSGNRRFEANDKIIQVVDGSIQTEPTQKVNHLQEKSVSGFLFHARFTPGFGLKWGVLIKLSK